MPGEDELIQLRTEKLARIRDRGIDPYPARVERTHTAQDAIAAFEAWESAGASGDPPQVAVAGRITSKRDMGKASFLDLRDGTGRIQVYVKKDNVGEEAYAALADLDLADFALATGPLFRTKTGEITIEARSCHGRRQGPPPAAREVARDRGHRDSLPPALPRLDVERGRAPQFPHARRHHRRHPPLPRRPRLHRGRHARPPVRGRRRRRNALRHAPPRPRPGLLPPHLARAAPQARAHRRLRPRL